MKSSRFFLAFFLLLALVLLTVLPRILKNAPTPPLLTYIESAQRLEAEQNIYAPTVQPGADQYKYSPTFSYLFRPLLKLHERAQKIVWTSLNVAFYLVGLLLGLRLFRRQLSFRNGFSILCLLACLMELNGSLLYGQVNAILAGAHFISFALFASGYLFWSAFILAWVAQFKILSLPLLGLLCLVEPKRFAPFALLSLLLWTLVPLISLSPAYLTELYQNWFFVLTKDLSRSGLLDLNTLLLKWGFPSALRVFVKLFISAATLAASLYLLKISPFLRQKTYRDINLYRSLALWSCALLLLNTGTESPTFALIGPAFFVLAIEPKATAKWLGFLPLFLVTFYFSDFIPGKLRLFLDWRFIPKTLGCLLLWLLLSFRAYRDFRRATKLSSPGVR